MKGTLSYVTGTHALKAGTTYRHATAEQFYEVFQDLTFTTNNYRPVLVQYHATPYYPKANEKAFGLFAQDQWTLGDLTMNLGLRYDYYEQGYPDIHLPATRWVALDAQLPGGHAGRLEGSVAAPRRRLRPVRQRADGDQGQHQPLQRAGAVPQRSEPGARQRDDAAAAGPTRTATSSSRAIRSTPSIERRARRRARTATSAARSSRTTSIPTSRSAAACGPTTGRRRSRRSTSSMPGVSLNVVVSPPRLRQLPGERQSAGRARPITARTGHGAGRFAAAERRRLPHHRAVRSEQQQGRPEPDDHDLVVEVRRANRAVERCRRVGAGASVGRRDRLQGGVSTGKTTTDNCDVGPKLDNPSHAVLPQRDAVLAAVQVRRRLHAALGD